MIPFTGYYQSSGLSARVKVCMKHLGFKLYQLQLPSEDYIVQQIKFLGIGKFCIPGKSARPEIAALVNSEGRDNSQLNLGEM